MSIYSGFTTRKVETQYMNTLYCLNGLVADRLIKLFSGAMVEHHEDAKFCRYFVKLFKKLRQLDESKHLEPHFSNSFNPLAVLILVNKDQLLGSLNDSKSLSPSSNISAR